MIITSYHRKKNRKIPLNGQTGAKLLTFVIMLALWGMKQ